MSANLWRPTHEEETEVRVNTRAITETIPIIAATQAPGNGGASGPEEPPRQVLSEAGQTPAPLRQFRRNGSSQ
eukprot:CAMPEP_0185769882 /NCGR_PEP_ID=MMETSP1174-20130828/56370_1 /TAXON_ID=35687 /ORGANISM="Dictyocha speculum, Strain CCMP1381" /LENGTH=72 /DNA_ID=CAMNT_0028455113 /DNA_START=26 /DNA_END=245 /DNA_ORIENTATION=-